MQKVIENLRKNGFEVFPVKDKAQALETAKQFFEDVSSAGMGGSESIKEVGLLDWMREQKDFQLLDQYEAGISIEENEKRRKKALTTDIFVTSSNAITESGYLVNVDATGNRVAAQAFGPGKVLLVVGKNKIVKDVNEGFERIDQFIAPKNVERINQKSIANNKPPKYTVENIQQIFCVTKGHTKKEPFIIILVDEALGY